jgi:hypothetical protein
MKLHAIHELKRAASERRLLLIHAAHWLNARLR